MVVGVAVILAEDCKNRNRLIIPILGVIVPNMGMKGEDMTGLGEVLFSKTQRQLLGLLFGNPDRSFFLNEIVRLAEVGIGGVSRELDRLSKAGLLTVTKVGNQKHYQANPKSPIFGELRGIVLKTFHPAPHMSMSGNPDVLYN